MPLAHTDWRIHAERLRPLVPDPCEPRHGTAIPALPPRVVRQRAARAAILGATRRIVAESGLDGVHMAQVARRSNVSVQTVYNLVGSRAEMLDRAACEWVEALAANAVRAAEARSLNTVFTMIELFWAGAVCQRDYAASVIRTRETLDPLEPAFIATTRRVIERELKGLSSQGALVRWADTGLLAEALARASHDGVREWLRRPYDAGRFRETLVNRCGLPMRGALAGGEIDKLERGLSIGWGGYASPAAPDQNL